MFFQKNTLSPYRQAPLRGGPDLSDAQFRFQTGRSTVDAMLHLRPVTEDAVDCGGVLLAVSWDIANAFNSLPFSCIRKAIKYHIVPEHLRRLVVEYLEERTIMYEDREGILRRLPMSLTAVIGGDLTISAIIRSMSCSDNCFTAVTTLCEKVISRQEKPERPRENDLYQDPIRHRRDGFSPPSVLVASRERVTNAYAVRRLNRKSINIRVRMS